MRMIAEIEGHSFYPPAMRGLVVDGGANKGAFSKAVLSLFDVQVIAVEANPLLAERLRAEGLCVEECALGAVNGTVQFNIARDDECSSVIPPSADNRVLKVVERVAVPMRTLEDILTQHGQTRPCCVKLDIEGGEMAVLDGLAERARAIAPQWTIEFHDHPDFDMFNRSDVDGILRRMKGIGFSILYRDWPDRMDVLLIDRKAIGIGLLQWVLIKLRYQFLARLGRLLQLRWPSLR
jgi:FkbM family methyltransferase